MKKYFGIGAFLLIITTSMYAQRTCNFWLGDGAGGFKSGKNYNTGDVIYVSGAGGADFTTGFPASGSLYIVYDHDSNDGYQTFNLVDVMSWSPNVIQSYLGGAAYIDEIIAIGPLPEGKYDIIIDKDHNGVYVPGTDCIVGLGTNFAFTVKATTVPPWKLAQLAQLKLDANIAWLEAIEATAAADRMFEMIKAVKLMLAVGKAFGKGTAGFIELFMKEAYKEITGLPLDYNGAVLKVGQKVIHNILKTNELHAQGIAADPPDYAYFNTAPTEKLNEYWRPETNQPFVIANAELLNAYAIENIALDGIFHSMEKIQAAQLDRTDAYTLVQARALSKYLELWKEANVEKDKAIDSLRTFITTNNLNDTLVLSDVMDLKNRIATTGFKQSELDELVGKYNFTTDMLDSLKAEVARVDTSVLFEGTTTDYLSHLEGFYDGMELSIDTLQMQMELIVTTIAPTLQDLWPDAHISISGQATVGVPFNLSATDSNSTVTANTFAWDTDMDSLYNDGSTASINHTFTEAGLHLVRVKATNSFGNDDYAYKIVNVVMGNKPPVLNAVSPVADYSVLDGTPFTCSVTASDPEADALSYMWIMNQNDTVINTQSSYNVMTDTAITNAFTACDRKMNQLEVKVFDNKSVYKTGHIWTMLAEPVPPVNLPDDTTLCTSCTIVLDPGSYAHATYNWSTGSSASTISVNSQGVYTVTITANGCTAIGTTTVNPAVGTGVENFAVEEGFIVYPNPSSGAFTIDYKLAAKGNVRLELFNLVGQTVVLRNQVQDAGNYKFLLDPRVYNLNGGNVYLLRATFGETVINKKLVIAD